MKKKDIQERNNLVKWAILISLVIFVLFVVSIFFIEFDLLRDPSKIKDHHLRIILIVIAGLFTLMICRRFICFLAYRLNNAYLKRFSENKHLGDYSEAKSKVFSPHSKVEHAVLLLHGFTASPQDFDCLTPYLEEADIVYYAPSIVGFGINTTQLLINTRCEDWFRGALSAFDNLGMLAKNISVVGHSMGGILATFIAQHRQVHNLILLSPGIFSVQNDLKYKKLLLTPWLSHIYSWIIPYLPKPIRVGRKTTSDTLDESVTSNMFQYMAIPISGVTEIFKAQNSVDIVKANFSRLCLLYGKHDLTVDNLKLANLLREQNVVFDEYCFENTAHNVLRDYDKFDACKIIQQVLLDRI